MKKTLLIAFAILAAASPALCHAQTVRVRCGTGADGRLAYKEVYEYDYVDDKPCFPGGECKLIAYINEHRRYPRKAYKKGIQGRVICSFIVNADGSVSNVSVLKGVEETLNAEAARILAMMPDWRPGRIEGIPVPVRVLYPIPFRK